MKFLGGSKKNPYASELEHVRTPHIAVVLYGNRLELIAYEECAGELCTVLAECIAAKIPFGQECAIKDILGKAQAAIEEAMISLVQAGSLHVNGAGRWDLDAGTKPS